MPSKPNNPIDALGRVFHEPKRLAIVSALAASAEGLSFGEIKESCELTDGNLNRHLKVLDEDSAICQRKSQKDGRPRTIVSLSPSGRKKFIQYLDSLETVLKEASQAVGKDRNHLPASPLSSKRPSQA